MTALAGVWQFDTFSNQPPLQSQCRSMLLAQRQYGRRDPSVAAVENVAFGCSLFPTLPEDAFDQQPLVCGDGRRMLVADVRLDNREEVLARLGHESSARISDSALLFQAYSVWGARLFDRICGDFALAIWDPAQHTLTLARDTSGQRPLHYLLGHGFIGFASMPRGLHGLQGADCAVDLHALAGFVADIPAEAGATYFKNVRRVPPGSVLKITAAGIEEERFWRLPDRELHLKDNEYVEAFREQLDCATSVRLRRSGGGIGAHLSGGLDSGAVAATAARLLAQDGGILALTSAPRMGYAGGVPASCIADETALAGATAALHPNMQQLVLRSTGISPLASLAADSQLYQEPVGLPCNQTWLSSVSKAAHDHGVSVMLTGEVGNLTISAGGFGMLPDFIRTGRWLRWSSEARASMSRDMRLRGVLAISFGPWLPRRLWNLLSRLNSGYAGGQGAAFLQEEWRSLIAPVAWARARGGRPEKDNRKLRWKLLQEQDMGNFRKGVLSRWQIDERDPTADRRLAEFCFALPPEQLLGEGQTRRLARLALADRLPAAVLNGPRGYQFADWHESLSKERLWAALEDLEASPAASLLDLRRLHAFVDQWPTAGWETKSVIATHRLALLRTLSAGYFAKYACQ